MGVTGAGQETSGRPPFRFVGPGLRCPHPILFSADRIGLKDPADGVLITDEVAGSVAR